MAKSRLPTIVIDMDGGLIHCVTADAPVRVIVIDKNTEGGDPEAIMEVDGEEVYVAHYLLTAISEDGAGGVNSGLAPTYVGHVVADVDARQQEPEATS